jgi:hypothetical protein
MSIAKIYTDTNALRYFGEAFANTTLADDLRDELLLAPLAVMELISQLGTAGAADAFAAVQAFPRIHNPAASGMLPWSDDLFRLSIFGLPPGKNGMMPALNNAINNVLDAKCPEDLFDDGAEIRALLISAKEESAQQFANVLDEWRSTGALEEAEHRRIFARSIARRAGLAEDKVDVDAVLSALNALYVFEKTRMTIGASEPEYNVLKHKNDVFDAELLIYLADPTLHLLTSDTGLNRTTNSSQGDRVHIVPASCLRNAKCAEETIRSVVKSVAQTSC